MRSLLLTLLCILGGAFALQAQMNKVEFERYQLDNGLTVILHEDNSTPIVAVTVLYHVGAKNEKPRRSGFAHFFEHLMFEGSENIGRGEFTEYIGRAGGTRNAYTNQDRTLYYEVLPSNQLGLGLWLESERMLHAIVDQKGVETQREVVKEERRVRYENQPYGTLQEEIAKRAFPNHPYKTTTIGTMEDLNAAEEADFKDFYETFYVPNNAVLSIAGDIDMAETKRLVKKYFGPIPKGEKEIFRPERTPKQLSSEVRDTVYDQVQLPAVVMSYPFPPMGSDDYYAMSMLNKVLSDGQSSRMYKSIVDEEQLAVAAGSFGGDTEHTGSALVFGVANQGVDPAPLEKAMQTEIDKVKAEMISEREFQKIRNQIESQFVSKVANMNGIAENLAVYETHYGDANLINTEIERYLDVTREDMLRVANKYFDADQRVVLYWLPEANQ